MTNYVCYSLKTGLIDHLRETSPELIVNETKPEDHKFLPITDKQRREVTTIREWCVDLKTKKFVRRPTFDIPTSLDLVQGDDKIYTVPNGTQIEMDGETFIVDDEQFEVIADVPGSYDIKLSYENYFPLLMRVAVNAN